MVFGGIGHNPFNPAIVARVGLLIGLPALMTTWVPPKDYGYMMDRDAWFFPPSTLKRLDASKSKDLPFSSELKIKNAYTSNTKVYVFAYSTDAETTSPISVGGA
jgi:Na+-translocating ferredoxin:NAD+ oxidoreductase RnfD subunit